MQATPTDWARNSASHTVTVTVDTQAPEINIVPTLIASASYCEPRTVNLTGEATDVGGVSTVEWRTAGGDWQPAELDCNRWRAAWWLGYGPLPDGATYTVEARAIDIVGRVTQVSQIVTVDVMPPAPVELTLSSDGSPVAPGDTLLTPATDLTLAWTASSDGIVDGCTHVGQAVGFVEAPRGSRTVIEEGLHNTGPVCPISRGLK